MPNLFRSTYGPPTAILNFYSSGSVSSGASIASAGASNTREVLAGAGYTANRLQTVITHTGRGCVNLLTAYSKDSTARTIRVRVTIDGAVVFDATSSSIATLNHGMVPIGSHTGGGSAFLEFQRVEYNESLLVEVASSLTEAAGNIGVGVNRETWVS